MRNEIAGFAALAAGFMASSVFASTVDLSLSNITNYGNQNIGSQLKVSVSDVSGQSNKVDVLIKNLVGITSSVKEVYFDAGATGTLFTTGMIQSQSGATFAWGSGSPGDLPGGSSLTPAFQTTMSLVADSGSGGPTTGLDQSADSLTVRLTLTAGKTFDDVVKAMLAAPGGGKSFRVGLHVISIGTLGGSDSYVSNLLTVPLPPAAWAGVSCLAAVIGAGLVRTYINRRH